MGQYFKAVLRNDRKKDNNSVQRFIDFLEENSVHVDIGNYNNGEQYLECEFYSQAGEDFIFTISGKTNSDLAKDLKDFYESFEPDSHAVENYGSKGAPSSLRLLLDDAEEIDKELENLSDTAMSKFKNDYDDLYIFCSAGGNKLTEHSWLGNWLTDEVSYMIHNNPMRVSWVGDYTDEKFDKYISDESICKTNNIPEIDRIWNKYSIGKDAREFAVPFDYKGKFVVNHTLGLYIDMDKYIEKSKEDLDGQCVLYPISLLCCSNNGSGGSYYGVNEKECEKWNWCEISIEDEIDETLEEFDIWFKE